MSRNRRLEWSENEVICVQQKLDCIRALSNSSKEADDSRVAGCLVPEASVWFIKGFHFLFRWQMQYFDVVDSMHNVHCALCS